MYHVVLAVHAEGSVEAERMTIRRSLSWQSWMKWY